MASIREINQNDDVFVGLKLPFRFGTTGFFNQSKTVKEQSFSNLKNLIEDFEEGEIYVQIKEVKSSNDIFIAGDIKGYKILAKMSMPY